MLHTCAPKRAAIVFPKTSCCEAGGKERSTVKISSRRIIPDFVLNISRTKITLKSVILMEEVSSVIIISSPSRKKCVFSIKFLFCLLAEPSRGVLKKGAVPSVFKWKKPVQRPDNGRAKRRLDRDVKRDLFKEDSAIVPDQEEVNVPFEEEESPEEEVQYLHEAVPFGCEEVVISKSSDSIAEEIEPDTVCESEEVPDTQSEHLCTFSAKSFENDDKGIHFYTGLESFEKFKFVFSTLCPEAYSVNHMKKPVNISAEDAFLLTLMKLRRNKTMYELHRFFGVSEDQASSIFVTWIKFIHQMWSMLDMWPSRELIDFFMPHGFRANYPSTRVIVDCTEIPIEKPKNPAAQQASFSTYKNRNTVKVEVGASPAGLISHISSAYGGSASDRQIVERSGLIDKCQAGDSVMADRGFNVQDLFAPKGVSVNIPSFMKGRSQLPGITVIKDRQLSSKRVHIERLIGLMKTYKILSQVLNSSYVTNASEIVGVCCMLCNFRSGIVDENA